MSILNNIFIITSTINTPWGHISISDRYLQTLETIDSIKKKDPAAIIILIDNSSFPLENKWYNELSKNVTFFIDIGSRTPCKELNNSGAKGAGEAYMLLVALDLIILNKLAPKRIFKISGRYKLSDQFDINFYNNLHDCYVFKTRHTNDYNAISLHTRLWSVCGTLIDNMGNLISKSFYEHLVQGITIEEAMFMYIDKSKLMEVESIHCEGIIAPWNMLIND